jgi:hypothetical protein
VNERTKDGRTNDGCSSTISRSLARQEIDRLSRDWSLTRRRKNGRRRSVELHGIMTIKPSLSLPVLAQESVTFGALSQQQQLFVQEDRVQLADHLNTAAIALELALFIIQ